MQSIKAFGIRSSACAAGLALLAGCQTGSAFRDPLARMNPDMQAVVMAYQDLGARPINTLTVQQARSQPTLIDAGRVVEQAHTGRPFSQMQFARVTDMTVPGAVGPLAVRLYDPMPGHPNQPIILFFHGGGGVTGSVDSGDASARALASQAHALVLSVDYRLAPEAPFPAAQEDGLAAYRWLLANAPSLGADSRRLALAGESAGATIALDTAMAARDLSLKAPVHIVLIEPIVSVDTNTRSAIANQRTIPFSRADEEWYFRNWLANPADAQDPRIDLLGVADLHHLPPMTIISSEMDPVESDATTITLKLQAQGVDVTRVEYQGTAHGFFGLGNVVARAKEAEEFAGNALDITFKSIGEPPAPPAAARRSGRRAPHRAWNRLHGS